MKRILIQVGIALLLVLGLVYGGFKLYDQIPREKSEIATAVVRQGDFVVRAYTRGELRAVRSATISAPNLIGSTQITVLAPAGSFAREKNLVVSFDDTSVQSRVVESNIELEKIQQSLAKSRADLEISANKDTADLLEARYGVRRAELQMKRNELISSIDARKNELTLEEARRRLERLQSDVQSKREQAEAQIRVLQEQRRKALIELNRDKARVLEAKSLSPITGLVALKQNLSAGGRFGAEVPELREGDEVSAGTPVVEVLDLSELEIIAKVSEVDRANLREGQDVIVRLDALPGESFKGKIKSMSSTATANVMSGDPSKKFDVFFSVDMDALLKASGATPEQIREIHENARRNRERAHARSGAGGAGSGAGRMPGAGGFAAGDGQGGGRRQQGGGQGAAGQAATAGAQGRSQGAGQGGGGQRGAGAGANVSPEDRARMQQAMQAALAGRNMQDLSADERRELFTQVRNQMGAATGGRRGMAQDDASLERGPTQNAAGFTLEELKNAIVPLPPSKDSGLDTLLRPGLLADVEIIVDEVKDAVTVPMQAVFEKDGKPIVYVRASGGFEARVVTPARRTESTMVVSEGIRPGDVIALSDPFANRAQKNQQQGSTGAPAGLPGGTR